MNTRSILPALLAVVLPLHAQTFSPTLIDAGDTNAGQSTSHATVAGNPAISYNDGAAGDLMFARNSAVDGSGTWTVTTVDSTGSVGLYSSLAIVNGNPAISYHDSTNGNLKYARNSMPDGSGTWTLVTVDNSANNVGRDTSLAVVNGVPAISYYDFTAGDLKFVAATDASGTAWGTPITVDTGGAANVGQYSSLKVLNGVPGVPAISYFDDTTDDLKFVLATNAAGTAWGTPVVLDGAASQTGQYTSMTVLNTGGAGTPAISYYTITGGDLMFARNSAADGSGTWTITSVDTTNTVGQHTSLAIINGNPAISYYDDTVDNLKFARNSAADGSGTWAIATVESAGDVGRYASLTTINGTPAISYQDFTNGDLKFARNSAADGSGAWALAAVDLGTPGTAGEYTSQTLVGGTPAIGYYGTIGSRLKFVRNSGADGSGAWTITTVLPTDGSVKRGISLATLANGRPAMTYGDVSGSSVKFVRSLNADGSSWNSSSATVESSGAPSTTSLAVVGGNPAVSYGVAGGLKLARNSLADGSGTWTVVVADATSSVVGHSSLAIVNLNPAISYYDQTNGNLRYVRATDANGTAWGTPVVVDGATSDVGQYTSLVIVNGNPAISYYDQSNGNLKYVRATDVNGTTWGTPVVVDGATSNVGQYTSLRIVGGLPVISYYDVTNGNLKYVSATNADGTAWGTPVVAESTGDVGQYASLVTLASGDPVISYYDVTNGDLRWARGVPAPEIAVEQPAGTDRAAGTATIDMGLSVVGNPTAAKTFTIKNTGVLALTVSVPATTGGNALDFGVNATGTLLSIPAGQQTTFDVTFTPMGGGARSTTLRITSNDANENPFDITLTGTGLATTTDTDGDGLNDAAEFNLAALGFNWQVSQPTLVTTLTSNYGKMQSNLNAAGYFTTTQVQALHIGTPLLEKSGGAFKLTLRLKKATTLSPPNFQPFAFTEAGTAINGQGEIEYQFTAPDDAAFFRLEAP